jgi:thiamine-monophosphate kinase
MPRAATIGDIGEWGFLRALLPRIAAAPSVAIGAGDDCAAVAAAGRRILLTTDALVEHVHFEQEWMSPRQLGRKAYLVNASDIAAMGGRPRFCLVSAAVPRELPARDLMDIERGIAAAAKATGASLVGGNLSRADELVLSVTLVGDAPKAPARRRGARRGDLVFVTGTLGDAAVGLRLLQKNSRADGAAVRRFREPRPRLAAGALLVAERVVSAMIDVSDGLLRDLGHVCAASGVGAEVRTSLVPRTAEVRRFDPEIALHGGEDYELLFAVRPSRLPVLERLRARLGCTVTCIGRVAAKGAGIRVLDEDGRLLPASAVGHDHFASANGRSVHVWSAAAR